MAVEAFVALMVDKLDKLLSEEAQLLGVYGEIKHIRVELNQMRRFLKDADIKKKEDEGVRDWVENIRDICFDVADVIDILCQGQAAEGRHGFVERLKRCISDQIIRYKVGKEIERIKLNIKGILRSRESYGIREINEERQEATSSTRTRDIDGGRQEASFSTPGLKLDRGFSTLSFTPFMASTKKITLKSSDGETFKVDKAVALQSQVIKHMIEDDCADFGIPIPNVTGKILAKVIEYCKKHVEMPKDADDRATEDKLKAWDTESVKVDQAVLVDLILAAKFLNINSLLDLTCQCLADMIKGKNSKILNIESNFTLEEEEELRREYQWAFE